MVKVVVAMVEILLAFNTPELVKVVVAMVERLVTLNTPELVTVKFVIDVILLAVNILPVLVVSPAVLDEVSVLEARMTDEPLPIAYCAARMMLMLSNVEVPDDVVLAPATLLLSISRSPLTAATALVKIVPAPPA